METIIQPNDHLDQQGQMEKKTPADSSKRCVIVISVNQYKTDRCASPSQMTTREEEMKIIKAIIFLIT